MTRKILITGGAGFIGSHLADELLRHGYAVRALDNLSRQVHPEGLRPAYLDPDVELVQGDVRDPEAVERSLEGVDAVFHFAAAVGVGQSMYEIEEYMSVNTGGTAVLLEALIRRPVGRLVVASSMSVYGEGLYASRDGRIHPSAERTRSQIELGRWDPCDEEGVPLTPLPTPEWKAPSLASVYALSKYDQERMCLIVGRAYGIDTVALRFFNVFGPRQALSNPYTGVLAIFASRLLNDSPPLVFEDGRQRRDFVDVRDVARACRLALETPQAAFSILNVGSGEALSVQAVARRMAEALGKEHIAPRITGTCRVGDIRNCFADIGKAREVLGYAPAYGLQGGLPGLAAWLDNQTAFDHAERAGAELVARGLAI